MHAKIGACWTLRPKPLRHSKHTFAKWIIIGKSLHSPLLPLAISPVPRPELLPIKSSRPMLLALPPRCPTIPQSWLPKSSLSAPNSPLPLLPCPLAAIKPLPLKAIAGPTAAAEMYCTPVPPAMPLPKATRQGGATNRNRMGGSACRNGRNPTPATNATAPATVP